MKKFVGVIFYSVIPVVFSGEINFSGVFDSFSGSKVSEQRSLEQKLEENLNNLRSIASSRVVIPLSQASHVESLWGTGEAKVLPVEVILTLHKRKRLTQNEYQSIYNMISSSLSEKNQIVQPVIRDQEGFEWTEESAVAKEYYQATHLENELWDRLNAQWGKDVAWTQVHVSEKDGACQISGTTATFQPNTDLQLRREVMTVLGGLCSSAKLSVLPKTKGLLATTDQWLQWGQNLSYVFVGFALWGLFFALIRLKKRKPQKLSDDDAGAIIMTKIAERSPDQAAKWMVRAMLSEKSEDPQIFDQSP